MDKDKLKVNPKTGELYDPSSGEEYYVVNGEYISKSDANANQKLNGNRLVNKDGKLIDPYNGIEYIELENNFIPKVAGGIPANLQYHDGKPFMVNKLGKFLVENGKVSLTKWEKEY